MSEEEKDLEVSTEERTAEEEATKEVNEDEIRDKLADDLGIDPEDDSDLLDKLVAREKAQREKLSGAIKQKISWREKAQKGTSEKSKENPEKGKSPQKETPEDPYEVARKVFKEELDNQALEQLDLPDDLKAEVKDLAKLKGISVREAARLPYIQNRKTEIEREERINNATPKRSNKGNYTPSYDPSKPLNRDDFDFSTEEGRQAWKDAKAARRKHQQQQ